jgi:hypothetical protein
MSVIESVAYGLRFAAFLPPRGSTPLARMIARARLSPMESISSDGLWEARCSVWRSRAH